MSKKNMVMASFAADSLALGAHWIYDTKKIETEIGTVDKLLAPLPDSFHKNKSKGDFTHYGDQTFWLLEFLSANKTLDGFINFWKEKMKKYKGYMDHASKETLKNGKGYSGDFSAVGRIAPVLYFFEGQESKKLAVEQAKLTHDEKIVVSSTEYFVEVIQKVVSGLSPVDAIKVVEPQDNIKPLVKDGIDSAYMNDTPAIAGFGQSCAAKGALPSVLHLIAKHPDMKTALINNVMAGGDSSARGMVLGAVYGAAGQEIPEDWLKFNKYAEIEKLLG